LFLGVLDQVTKDHGVLMCDFSDTQETQLINRYFSYKAEIDVPEFELGDEQFRGTDAEIHGPGQADIHDVKMSAYTHHSHGRRKSHTN